ncbi:phage/plasmid primase, P4 family, partial [bacterium]|nr:phage/plasmid primase, P4 family [bacterium]
YALKTPPDTLLAKRDTAIPNDIARLRGARFVSAVELEAGRRLAESRLKELTGGDTVTARFMRGEWFDFQPVCKFWIATNHKPTVQGTDEAVWRRIRLIPFAVTIPTDERDPTLPSQLATELPGILRWTVSGCREWQQRGLAPPPAVTRATREYREEEDLIGAFLDECCLTGEGRWCYFDILFRRYEDWCRAGAERVLTSKAFAQRLEERGFKKDRRHGKKIRLGLDVRPDEVDGLRPDSPAGA